MKPGCLGGAAPARPACLVFGPFEFDPVTGELWREGAPVRLQQQPARVLALLVTHPGELLSRDQIRHHVWDEKTSVDFRRGLNFAVMQIRNALGDEAGSPRYVETLARRGYRFVAPVEGRDAAAAGPAAGQVAPAGGPARPAEVPPAGAGAVLAVRGPRRPLPLLVPALAAVVLGLSPGWPQRPAPAADRTMVAVVPFRNLGPADEQFFADGMTDEVSSRLASIRGLGVVSPTSHRHYAGTTKSIRQIGSELGAEYVLEGSVRWERPPSGPARVRVTPKLVRVADEVQVWARIWEREVVDVFRLQSELAREMAAELSVRGRDAGPWQREAALDTLEQVAAAPGARFLLTAPHLEGEPSLWPLHDQPRFRRLVASAPSIQAAGSASGRLDRDDLAAPDRDRRAGPGPSGRGQSTVSRRVGGGEFAWPDASSRVVAVAARPAGPSVARHEAGRQGAVAAPPAAREEEIR